MSSRLYLTASQLIVIFLGVFAFAQGGKEKKTLYLLTGTPTMDSPVAFPVDLYTTNPLRRLTLVRQVVEVESGLYAIRGGPENVIYVLYPHITPTTVNIIHKEEPALVDEVRFNVGGLTLDSTALGVAADEGSESYALLPLLRRPPDHGPISVSLTSIASRKTPHVSRIATNEWFRYQSFDYEGSPGGPGGPGFVPLGYIKDNFFYIQVSPPGRPFANAPSGKQVALAEVSPVIPPEERSGPFYIVAASQRFLVIASTPGHSSLYVYDRKRGAWIEIQSSSTVPYTRRLFGSWLATIVEIWRPQGGGSVENPGHDHERAWGTETLPNVREGYAFGQGRDAFIPGKLSLDNLEDGRRIMLQTNEEDSEILDVGSDGLVLYRVNDSIYQAQIDGDKLSAPTLVVKDDDVPEVHWAFWSNAEVNTEAVTPKALKSRPGQ